MSSPKNYTKKVVPLDTERHGASDNVLINAKKDVLKSTSFFVLLNIHFHSVQEITAESENDQSD